jgi:hypothetical protein
MATGSYRPPTIADPDRFSVSITCGECLSRALAAVPQKKSVKKNRKKGKQIGAWPTFLQFSETIKCSDRRTGSRLRYSIFINLFFHKHQFNERVDASPPGNREYGTLSLSWKYQLTRLTRLSLFDATFQIDEKVLKVEEVQEVEKVEAGEGFSLCPL